MYGTSQTAQPTGRGELLLWINSVCTAQYPSVESLRDGVAYCTIVDAAASRVAENCNALGLPEANVADARAKRASRLLSRLEWSVTATTCTNQDPSSDTLQERGYCEKNMQTLQLMLRGCVPPEFSLEVDVPRLAAGKLQEHIVLLKWMYQFLKKMLSTYSRSALERRANTYEGSGQVEGVRMTRAMKLQQKMVRKKYGEPDFVASPSENETKHTEIVNSAREDSTTPKFTEAKDSDQAIQRGPSPAIESGVVEVVKDEIDAFPKPQLRNPDETNKHNLHLKKRNSQLNTEPTDSNFSSSVPMTPASFSVPQECFAMLEDLRQEVESYEAVALATHRRHQRSLTGSKNDEEGSFADEGSMNEELQLTKSPILSLEQLGLLLEERDQLWQTLEVLHDVLARNLAGEGEGSGRANPASPLVRKIMLALHPL
ncbi:uncharacterized protein Tco025E_03194 [Trypanosoma conorhini]|uniref:Calponin-homology (CH) domain-containing protein n=1 Tax=Trypanosoma conorhini TaxID=83891 RepID=A0A422PXC4_9TRYP|nr:uncharacterized protein Tco025E_03194 [Trypanosoma conorhini]RNF22352.1 hypothetical protein Tco025E_03194 [Trypanosoma conorhini]